MGVVSLLGFRTEPGRLADHLAASAEALGHLRRLGLQAANFQTIAGGDVGVITTAINYANNADWAAGFQLVQGDEKFLEFWLRTRRPVARRCKSRVHCSPMSTRTTNRGLTGLAASFCPRSGGRCPAV